ncbi:MAG: hypothetical protein H7A44_08110 [Opitutaceae bacterium]|nr:hypothetical protein [Candidatus Eremiobacteraeota bacterium]MCB1103355.1 hypothetical protein [Cephaloticoccus sp.]MCP5530393.1 hypothetical protein [Opitutaceae bacterium]
MHTVSSFNSLFELSVGVHLVFSLFEELQGRVLREYKKQYEQMVKKRDSLSPKARNMLRHNVDDIGYGLHLAECSFEDLSVIFRRVAFVIAGYSVAVLLVSGFNPAMQLSGWAMNLLLAAALLPAPFMIAFSHGASKQLVRNMGDLVDECYSELNSAVSHDTDGSLELWAKMRAESDAILRPAKKTPAAAQPVTVI